MQKNFTLSVLNIIQPLFVFLSAKSPMRTSSFHRAFLPNKKLVSYIQYSC